MLLENSIQPLREERDVLKLQVNTIHKKYVELKKEHYRVRKR